MNTIKELNSEANRIVSEIFNKEYFEICDVSVCVLTNKYIKGNLHISASYFVKSKGKNIHGSVYSESFESVLEKLKIKANSDKDFLKIDNESKGKPTIDIEFGI